MDVAVRVYLRSKIVDSSEYKVIHYKSSGSPCTKYYLRDMEIHFSEGRFSMDTINGVLPHWLDGFSSEEYSIRSLWNDGFRLGGLYRDKRYDKAEAEVKMCKPPTSYNVMVCGTNLAHVLNLHQAILTGELLPIQLGGASAMELAEELLTVRAESATTIDGLKSQIEAMKAELASKPWYRKLRKGIEGWVWPSA